MTKRTWFPFAALLLFSAQLAGTQAFGADTIFARAGEDGSISLSNVPTGAGYQPLVGAAPGEARTLTEPAGAPAGVRASAKARFDGLVEQTASAVGVDSALLHAVISVESRYDPAARSPKGAAGLMQLMPTIARRYGVTDAFDPAQNLQGGARYLRDLLMLFDSDLSLALAAYNAGETAVARHGKQIPPFRETVAYVPRVLAYYRKYQSGG
jgi:soluble lytic murein transglycosylase-like protein